MVWTAPKASTKERGYDAKHQRERKRLKPTVDAGHAWCQQGLPGNGSSGTCIMPTRQIHPWQRWALGHTDDRTAYIGTVHHQCNQRDGAQRGAQARNAKTPRHTASRNW